MFMELDTNTNPLVLGHLLDGQVRGQILGKTGENWTQLVLKVKIYLPNCYFDQT